MTSDDARMHGGNTPGLVSGRKRERHEEPVDPGRPEPGASPAPPLDGPTRDMMQDLDRNEPDGERDSALGGHVGTRSGTASQTGDETGSAS